MKILRKLGGVLPKTFFAALVVILVILTSLQLFRVWWGNFR